METVTQAVSQFEGHFGDAKDATFAAFEGESFRQTFKGRVNRC